MTACPAPRHTCRDCAAEDPQGARRPRPAPHPGPRCHTHHRAVSAARRARDGDTRRQRTYGLRPGEYDALVAAQGGRCAICRRATGATRALAVDHEHALGLTREAVRGALCKPCNRILGHWRDNPAVFERAAEYLRCPPARAVLGTEPAVARLRGRREAS